MSPNKKWNPDEYLDAVGDYESLSTPLFKTLGRVLKAEDRVLDVGCGVGHLTKQIQGLAKRISVVGIDANEEMVAAAKANGIDAHHANITTPPFTDEFDVVFSHAALHWLKDNMNEGIAGISQVLKESGRLVAEFSWCSSPDYKEPILEVMKSRGYGDVSSLDPLFTTNSSQYREMLTQNGFIGGKVEEVVRSFSLPHGPKAWVREISRDTFLKNVPDESLEEILAEVENAMRPKCFKDERWTMTNHRLLINVPLAAKNQEHRVNGPTQGFSY